MKRNRLAAVLVGLVLCLAGASPCAAAETGTDSGLAAALEKGQRLVQAERYDDACNYYLGLLREYPDEDRVNLGLARSAALAKRWPQAFLAYERLVANNPEHAGLRMEFAGVLTRMGNVEAARLELETARKLDPSSISTDASGKILGHMRENLDSFRVLGRAAAGLRYVSNMNTAPALRGVRIGGLPIALDSRNTAKETMGDYIQGALDMGWRANPYSDWWLVGDVAGYQRWNFRSGYRRDLTFGRAAAGVRYLKDNMMFEVRGKGETILENEDRTWNIGGAETTSVYVFKPDLLGIFRGGIERRDDADLSERSGMYYWGGPYARWYFGEANHSVMAGVKAYTIDASSRRYAYYGVEPSLTFFFNLPLDFELLLSAQWHTEQYKGPATALDGSDRLDRQFRGSSYLIYKVTDNLRLELGWQYTNNRSNSDLYEYEQHMVMSGIAWNF